MKIPICYDDDDDEESYIPLRDIIISGLPPCVAITPVLSTEEPVDSLIMEDEHLDNMPATELDEVIKSGVEDLVPIPSESEGILDKMCDVPFRDNSPPFDISKEQFEGFSDSNNDSTSIDDDSFSIDDIDYVEASPPDSELVSLEKVKDFHTKDGEIEDDILREKLSKINLLIAKIEELNTNPTLSSDFVTKSPSTFLDFFLEETNTFDNSLPESETFCFDLEENNSGSTTTRSNYFLSDYEAFYFNDDHIEEKENVAQPGMNMGQDKQMQMVRGNGRNQFRQYAGQNVGNQNGYNAVQNVGNQFVQNAVQNPGVQNVGNQNGLIVVLGIANQNPNGNGNVVAARTEGNANGNNGNQIRCYNCKGLGHLARNCIVRPRRRDAAYLQTQLLILLKRKKQESNYKQKSLI
ncbi:ribonuclease H-like domain-containing protein [Tanacetum coccineum]